VGKAITLELARAGANVVINYRSNATEAARTAAEAAACGVEALPIQADVADPDQIAAMVKGAQERFGGVDILVLNASYFERTPLPTTDTAAWRRSIDILVHGPFYCANAVAPLMLARGAGCIVSVLDLSAWEPWPHLAAHSVGKAALLALTRQLALELAPKVRANAVAPSAVLPAPWFDAKQVERLASRNLLQRWGAPEDVARAVRFLVETDFITGETITLDGGERFGHCRYRFADAEAS
jgi:NAD(P)-dependent dehydrogenase (short-subunit alcohol dehydrogenase family)